MSGEATRGENTRRACGATGMFVLGVTGGVGSGKSTVARLLERRGARVLDADTIVHELYAGGELPRAIASRFGEGVIRSDGGVDRARLGALVFADPAARTELEALVHPAVRARIVGAIDAWRRAGFVGMAVVDAALLVESAFPYPLDALVVVTAPETTRLARLEARGMPSDDARRRMRAQASDAQKARHATHVLANEGTLEELDAGLDRILEALGRDTRTLLG